LIFGDEKMAVFSVVKLSELEGGKRIDAEYYKPEYLNIYSKLNASGPKTFLKRLIKEIVSGSYVDSYFEKGTLYLRVNNITEFGFDLSDIKFVDTDFSKIPNKIKIKTGDLVLGRTGTIGITHLVDERLNGSVISQHITKIVVDENQINKYYLVAYLNSDLARKQMMRESLGSMQAELTLEATKNLIIFIPSNEFQARIGKLIQKFYELQRYSQILYSQAENILLEELGFKDFKPKYEKTYTANLSDALSVHRIDAEYFQPAYNKVIEKIKERAKVEKLKNITSFINHGKQPYYVKDGDIPVLIQKHLGPQLLSLHSEILNMPDTPRTDREFIKNYPEYLIKPFDVLFYSVGAYLGRVNVVLENFEAVPASFITFIRTKQEVCNPVYLALFLNSEIGQLQSSKWKSASAQQYIYPKEIKEFIIPILPFSTQQKIASLIQKSHEARKKAKELLNVAKKAVEIAIEKSEKDALNYLSSFNNNY